MQKETTLYRRIVSGQTGSWSYPLRGLLRAGAWVYGQGVARRNIRYDGRAACTTLPLPVISVGNLTVGGTGKTPMVIHLARLLKAWKKTPAVVSRGYGSKTGDVNDEERLIRRRCPGVVCVADADRVAGARTARQRHGADVIILDDGFQHRRLARDLDIVLIDATCPFGYGRLLPRGLLREPLESLCRADVIVVTRSDQVAPTQLERIEERLALHAPSAALLKCNHRVTGVERLDGTPLETPPAGRRALVTAGIGRPGAFLQTVRSLGVNVVATRWWPDHHPYTRRDVDTLLQTGRRIPFDLVLTTEKDAVKLADIPGLDPDVIGVVKIDIDFTGTGDTILQTRLRNALNKEPPA